ncbi:MAG: hypothetical protein JNN25_07720 [Candidatus Kapabacteria bacterium]|nr:hypothetical protein [Candidatus Kapabacteria bacterium]
MVKRKELAARVTRLESFRRYRDEQDYDKSTEMREQLVREIISPAPSNRKMQMGTAFHSIIAKPNKHLAVNRSVEGEFFYQCDGYRFPDHVIEAAKRHVDYDAVFELPTYKFYNIDDTEILITGTCDHLRGTQLTDFKTRWFEGQQWGVWDDNNLRETYEASYQWRFYCDMFGADEFQYMVFAMRDRNPIELVKIKTDIVCVPYHTMRRDIDDLLYDFLHFVRVHELEPHLQRTEREERILEEAFV